MKRMLLLLALVAPWSAQAEPASKIAWTAATLNVVKNADPEHGKTLAAQCAGCHGEQGLGVAEAVQDDETLPAVPAIAGQVATYTYKQLRDYADGSRQHAQMQSIAQGLNAQDTADLAAWFATLPRAASIANKQNLARAEHMVEAGDGKRLLPPCFVCHGSKGLGEKQDIPALAGQQADYFARTLLAYKSGERHNDVYSRMRLIAEQLSEDEIKELAAYYQQLR